MKNTALMSIGGVVVALVVLVAVFSLWGVGFVWILSWLASLGAETGTRVLLLAPFVLLILGAAAAMVVMALWPHKRSPH